tara:strand:- start:453 stop:863 length:411 start_codon:yes stop_codon:yes gene_type:complete
MIVFCRHCGRLNNGDYTSVKDAKCQNCGKTNLLLTHRVAVECPKCHIVQHKCIWNFQPGCSSCGYEIKNPLHEKCWGRTVNKGHNFKKFSLNLKPEELDWLKKMSKEKGVQIGQIIRLLVRKEGGLICQEKKIIAE